MLRDQEIVLNQSENTEYVWLSVDKALQLYAQDEMPLFPPQVLILRQLQLQAKTYNEVKAVAKRAQANPLTYLSERNLTYRLANLDKPGLALKQTK